MSVKAGTGLAVADGATDGEGDPDGAVATALGTTTADAVGPRVVGDTHATNAMTTSASPHFRITTSPTVRAAMLILAQRGLH
jgi:hypothetical protein